MNNGSINCPGRIPNNDWNHDGQKQFTSHLTGLAKPHQCWPKSANSCHRQGDSFILKWRAMVRELATAICCFPLPLLNLSSRRCVVIPTDHRHPKGLLGQPGTLTLVAVDLLFGCSSSSVSIGAGRRWWTGAGVSGAGNSTGAAPAGVSITLTSLSGSTVIWPISIGVTGTVGKCASEVSCVSVVAHRGSNGFLLRQPLPAMVFVIRSVHSSPSMRLAPNPISRFPILLWGSVSIATSADVLRRHLIRPDFSSASR